MSTRMPIASAMPPSDMMLIVLPVTQSPNNDPSRASGMLDTTTITLLQSRRNRRIIRPVKPAPIRPSVATLSTAATTVGDSSNSKLTVTSLGTASRNICIALWTSATTVKRRARVLLDDRQIDRLLAVDQRVAVGDVGIVLDRRHVAEVDVLPHPERDIAQLLDVDDRRVVGDHRHRVLDVDVPRRDDRVPRRQGIDDLLWSQVVVEELLRVDVDDDRPHVRAEGRDRDRAGDVLLHQRPDDVLRQVAHRPSEVSLLSNTR